MPNFVPIILSNGLVLPPWKWLSGKLVRRNGWINIQAHAERSARGMEEGRETRGEREKKEASKGGGGRIEKREGEGGDMMEMKGEGRGIEEGREQGRRGWG